MQRLSIAQLQGVPRLRGLLFDVDDTFLSHGRLEDLPFRALVAAHDAGLKLVAVTGRPAEWGRILCQQWPVDGFVSENGAVCWHLVGNRPTPVDSLSASERLDRRASLQRRVMQLREDIPELVPADDVQGRVSDFTFDIGEYRRLAPAAIERAVAAAHRLGLRTSTSSVHLHVSLDCVDKASGALRFLTHRFGSDPTLARFEFAYIGDSSNDGSCFAAFATSIGVANLQGQFTVPPRYVTRRDRGEGFAEAVGMLVDAQACSESQYAASSAASV